MENDRPISLISSISKVIEKIISLKITNFLTKFGILSSVQHGFFKDKSTNTAIRNFLLNIYEIINIKYNNNYYTIISDTVYNNILKIVIRHILHNIILCKFTLDDYLILEKKIIDVKICNAYVFL